MMRLLSWLVTALTYSWSRSHGGAHAGGERPPVPGWRDRRVRCRAVPNMGTQQNELPCRPPGGRDRHEALAYRGSRLDLRAPCGTTMNTWRRVTAGRHS